MNRKDRSLIKKITRVVPDLVPNIIPEIAVEVMELIHGEESFKEFVEDTSSLLINETLDEIGKKKKKKKGKIAYDISELDEITTKYIQLKTQKNRISSKTAVSMLGNIMFDYIAGKLYARCVWPNKINKPVNVFLGSIIRGIEHLDNATFEITTDLCIIHHDDNSGVNTILQRFEDN